MIEKSHDIELEVADPSKMIVSDETTIKIVDMNKLLYAARPGQGNLPSYAVSTPWRNTRLDIFLLTISN